MAEEIPLVIGIRSKTTEAAVKAAMLRGEIAHSQDNDKLWLKRYDDTFKDLSLPAGAGNLNGNLTPGSLLYALDGDTIEDLPLSYDLGSQLISGNVSLSLGSNINLDYLTGQIDSLFLHVHSSAVIDGNVDVNSISSGDGNFTVDLNGNVYAAGTLTVDEQARFKKSTIFDLAELTNVGGDVQINAVDSDFFEYDLVSTTHFLAPLNPAIGRRFTLRIRTIGTGPASPTWNPVFAWSGVSPSAPNIDTSYSGYWYLDFIWNQANSAWQCYRPVTLVQSI